jgi:periplasmic protein TonB
MHMRKFVFILFALMPFILSGKDTRKVTIEYFYPPIKEIYYVLKSDTTVRHGSYRIVSEGKILIQGYYNMGKRDSLWTRFNQKGKPRYRGYYSEDKRVGVWDFYDDKGEPEQQIDFTNNYMLLYRTQLAGNSFVVYHGSDSIYSLLDRPPLYLGGASRIKEYLAEDIVPPLHKAQEKVIGTVFIAFIIDSTGITSRHHVLKGIGTRCNLEALRLVKALPDSWFPGILNGQSVTVKYVIPVVFDENLYKRDHAFIRPDDRSHYEPIQFYELTQ